MCSTRRLRIFLALLVAASVAPLLAEKTDRIQFAEALIIGEVKSLELGVLRISTDYSKQIEADWEQILRIESELLFEVELRNGDRYFGSLAPSDEDRVLVVEQEGDAGAVRLPFADVVTLYQTKTTRVGKFDADIALGFSYVQATATSQATLDGGFLRRTKKFYTRWRLFSVLSDTPESRFSRNDLTYSAQRRLAGRWTYEPGLLFQNNESLGLEQRWLASASAVYRLWRSEIRELQLGAGLAASREEYIDDRPGDGGAELALSFRHYAFHFDDPELSLNTRLWVYPSLSRWGRYRVQLDSDVRRELISDLFWNLGLHWTFDSDPLSRDANRSDVTVSFALGWTY